MFEQIQTHDRAEFVHPGWTTRINHGYASVVEVGGELTEGGIDFVIQAIYSDQGRPVVVDLTRCAFIDSAGVALLRSAARNFKRHGVKFLIAGARGRVERILSLSDVTPDIYPSSAAALASLTPEDADPHGIF